MSNKKLLNILCTYMKYGEEYDELREVRDLNIKRA